MELDVYKVKNIDGLFPMQWIGLFEALSSNNPLGRAESWLAESRWYLKSWKMEPLWPDLIKVLVEKEPCIDKGLKFVPKIHLVSLAIQRNLLAFVVQHAVEITTENLVSLRDCYGNCIIKDHWSALHLKDLQNQICIKRDQGIEFKARDMVTIRNQQRITDICDKLCGQGKEEAVEEKHGDIDTAIAVPLNRTNDKSRQSQFINSSSLEASIDSWICDEIDVSATDNEAIIKPQVCDEKNQENGIDNKETGELSNNDLKTTSNSCDLPEVISKIVCSKNMKRLIEKDEAGITEDITEDETNRKKQHINEEAETSLMQEYAEIDEDVKLKLDKLCHALRNCQTSPVELDCLSNFKDAQMSIACKILRFNELDVMHLLFASQQLVRLSNQLSSSGASLLAKHCFLKKVLDLSHPPPGNLIAAIVIFSEAFPKSTIQSLLIPVIQSDVFGSSQCDLVTKVMRELEMEHQCELLRKLLKNSEFSWSVHVTSVIQSLIDSKLQVKDSDLSLFTSGLEHQAMYQNSCPRFTKLLLITVQRYGKQMKATHAACLRRVLETNSSFLKKAVLSALGRLDL